MISLPKRAGPATAALLLLHHASLCTLIVGGLLWVAAALGIHFLPTRWLGLAFIASSVWQILVLGSESTMPDPR
jgi:hypothetical protein